MLQKYGEFNVEASQVIEFNTRLLEEKLAAEDTEDSNEEYRELKKAYNDWLQYCNCLDQAEVFSLLQKEDFMADSQPVLILGSPLGKIEV